MQVFASPAIGQASYAETMQYFGTVRGRFGYAPAQWMFYATGGFAWTYDQFTRTQVFGMPAGGTPIKTIRRGRIDRATQNHPVAPGLYAAATLGVSASAESNAFSMVAIVSSVSSPMFEMRKVFPFSLP